MLGGVDTDVDKTIIDLQRTTVVQETGVGPDLEIEFFMLKRRPSTPAVAMDG